MMFYGKGQPTGRGMGTNGLLGTVGTSDPGAAYPCVTAVATATTDAILEGSGVSGDMCPDAKAATSALIDAFADARGTPTTAVGIHTGNIGASTQATTGAERNKQYAGTGDS